MRNLKLAFRTLFKTPFVTTVAALSLALGIGANTAIYSMFDEMLRRPLPVFEPQRLVNISAPGVMNGSTSCNQSGSCDQIWSYPMFRDLEKNPGQFSGIAGHVGFGANLKFEDRVPMEAQATYVTGGYFSVLGLQPTLGRLLTPADDETPGAHFVTVISHTYWETHLGSDPNVVGKTLLVNGQNMTIVGVGPKGFDGTTLGSRPYVFVPLTMRAVMSPGWRGFENRRQYWIYAFARLKPGVTIDQAKAAINAVYKPILLNTEVPLQEGMSDQTMARFKSKEVVVVDGRRGQSQVHREAGTPIMLLFAVTGVVLLIACANIANLLLAKAANRSMEMAVRLSLGGSRRQLLTQLLTESVVLAVIGGVASILVARWTLDGIVSILPDDARETMNFGLNWGAVAFAAALSVATGLLFGLFPALHSTRPDLVTELRNNSGKLSGSRAAARFRSALVTAQIALSMSLLIFGGLFIRSLANVSRVDLGLDVNNLVTFTISPGRNGYDSTRSKALFARTTEELAATPGVVSVTSAAVPLLAGNNWGNSVRVQGFERGPDTDAGSSFNMVGPAYFETIQVPILAGRDFNAGDEGMPAKVAIVNESFAKKFGLGRDAVGKFISQRDTGALELQVVGLIKDAKYSEVKDSIPPQFFIPYRQVSNVTRMNFYVRSSGDPVQLLRQIPGVVRRIDPNLPIENLNTMPQVVRENVFLDRMISILATAFAILATILAAVGLYGVLAYSVAQRTREIGVRMALGASMGNVRGMVLRQVAIMTLIGGVIGIGGAIALGRGAKSLLFQISGYDPLVMGASAVLLALVALSAGYVPAVKASKVDPMNALRYE
ncbi:MAG TPA: ABC transporter permease [Gemmatimonadaceae bacterium]|nr:ABC transporter permease [Gemmatimonadaceae bacterium]